jgi:hypothetical protein
MNNYLKLSKMNLLNLENLGACREAIKFSLQFNTSEEAWNACERGDWMLWLAKKLKVDNHKLTLAKGMCANTVIHLMKDQRSKDAVKASIDFGNGLIDEIELAAAADAADAAAYAAADAAAAAADAAAADAAAYADAAADAAAYADAAADARKKNQLLTASICKEILTEEVMQKVKELIK